MPSNVAPMRSMAARLRVLRASVQIDTRWTCHSSNAWPSRSSLASVLMGVRWADAANHVPPLDRLDGANCRGEEKARRLSAWLAAEGLTSADLWAYGDSSG